MGRATSEVYEELQRQQEKQGQTSGSNIKVKMKKKNKNEEEEKKSEFQLLIRPTTLCKLHLDLNESNKTTK